MLLDSLNKKQLEATKTLEGPVIIIAGAGSGKTRVLTHRIAYLISEGIPVDNILAITFTNKAANEMRERVVDLVGEHEMWISTFHSMCVRILRRHIHHLDYDNNFSIIDEDDRKSIIKKIMKDNNIDINLSIRQIVNLINRLKHNLEVEGYFDDTIEKLDITFNKYEEYLKENNLLDFEDLLLKTVILFQQYKKVLKIYQEQFQYILVDEYQDTNDIQNDLIMMLGAKNKNIFLVGDEDQSIYKFRGANYKNLRNFEKKFPKAKVILLEQNYRSTQNILSAANKVIDNNKSKHKKKLWTDNEDGDLLTYYRAVTDGDESLFIGNEINYLINKGIDPEEIAVLYRSNHLSRLIEEGLRAFNISYRVYGGVGYFRRREVKDLVAYLSLIVNPENNWSLYRVINTPKRGIGPATLQKIVLEASRQNLGIFEICKVANDYFPKALATKLKSFASTIIELQELIEKVNLDEFIDLVIVNTNYKEYLDSEGEEGVFRYENLQEFKSIVQGWALNNYTNKEKLELILADITLQTDQDREQSGVNLMTMHNAKGLEFDYVFIYGMEEGIFPNANCLDSVEETEEERRLAYVSITRARKRVYLTNSNRRRLFGQTVSNQPSRFINEIGEELIELKGVHTTEEQPIFTIKKTSIQKANDLYSVGDKVTHTTFGNGVVVQLDDEFVQIAFKAPYGIKKLMSGHESIKKQ